MCLTKKFCWEYGPESLVFSQPLKLNAAAWFAPILITIMHIVCYMILHCFSQLGWLWTAGRLWTIFQHCCIVSVQRVSKWNVSYCEVQLPIIYDMITSLWNSLFCIETIQRCWKIVQSCPRLTVCTQQHVEMLLLFSKLDGKYTV